MRQNMPFGARPTDSIEGIMPVQIGGSARGYLADLSHRLRSGIVGHNGTIASVPWISMQARRAQELTHLPQTELVGGPPC